MYMYTPGHSRIMGLGIYLPEKRVKSHDLLKEIDTERRFGIPVDWLDRVMGISERRAAPEEMQPSEMASRAAVDAIASAGVPASDIDAIIYAGVDRDFLLEPATAHVVQDKIAAHNAVCFDVTNACHGFMNGIHLMDALIATGQARRGLVVSGEQGSRYATKAVQALRQARRRDDFQRLVGGLTLGDAGAAIVLGPKNGPDSGFLGFMLQSQGRHSNLCTCGKRGAESPLETDMAAIIQQGIALLGGMYPHFLKKLGWTPSDIKHFVHHQVGTKVFKHHASYAQISPTIMPNTVTELGNLVTANIPVCLYQSMKNNMLRQGDRIFIAGAGSGLAISQAGLVWDALAA